MERGVLSGVWKDTWLNYWPQSQSHKTAPTCSDSYSKPWLSPSASDKLAAHLRFPTMPPWVQQIYRAAYRAWRTFHFNVYQFIIKDMDGQQPGEEVPGWGPASSQTQELFPQNCSVFPPSMWMHSGSPTWKLSELHPFEFLRRLHYTVLKNTWTSLVVQGIGIHLPMQGTQVWSLVQEDSTCCRATKPMGLDYWACTLEPKSCNYGACMLQLLKPMHLEPVLCSKRSHSNEKPMHHDEK